MKHFGYGCLGSVMSFITSAQLSQSISPDQLQQLINAVTAIIAGIITGFLSKWLNQWFTNTTQAKQLATAQQQLIDLQQLHNQQILDSNKTAKTQ